MKTNIQQAKHTAFRRGKKQGEVVIEQRVMYGAIILILLLLYLIFAQYNAWFPFQGPRLGSAFYQNEAQLTPDASGAASGTNANANGQSSVDGNQSGTDSGSSGDNGSNGSSMGGSTDPADSGNAGNPGSSEGSGSSGTGAAPAQPTAPSASAPTPAAPPNTDPKAILNLAASLNTGMTLADLNVKAGGVSSSCAIFAGLNLVLLGQQKVCIFSQDGKIITVTLLDDKVISASKNGF